MTVYTSLNLGPQIVGMENGDDPFILQAPEFYALQAYVEAGQRLPTNGNEMELLIGIPVKETGEFKDILEAYANIVTHCKNFWNLTFPESVKLAGDIVFYAKRADIYYTELLDIAIEYNDASSQDEEAELERDFRILVKRLRSDAQKFAANAEEVSKRFQVFLEQTEGDERAITPLHTKYRKRFDAETGSLAETRKEIEALEKEMKEATRNYEKAHYKAYKEPLYYGWVGFIGAAVAVGMMITQGNAADRWKAKMNELQKKIDEAKGKEKQAERFIEYLELANDDLGGIKDKIHEALPVISKLRGNWLAIEQELGAIVQAIDSNFEDLMVRLVKTGVKEMIKRWNDVAKKADIYRVVAFIRIVPETEIDFMMAHLRAVA